MSMPAMDVARRLEGYYSQSVPPQMTGGTFDPGDNLVDEVKAYVTANPSQVQEVLAAEVAGKNRATLVPWLTTFLNAERGAAAPGDSFTPETTIGASDAGNAAELAALGYVAVPLTAWTAGQHITVNGFAFHWDGDSWEPGNA